jgi:hypothetical protein
MVKISLTNAKLGGKIPSVNLPAGLTCRADAPCQKGCYAKKGNFTYKKVKQSLENNLNTYLNNPKQYFNEIVNFLTDNDVTYKFFRWHSAGDIVNYDYLLGMIDVAKRCKKTKFLCFTKKFFFVNHYLKSNELPKNLKIVFSAWDKTFEVLNPYNMPVTYVNFKDASKNADIPEFAIPCIGDCKTCKACWSLKPGQSVYFNQH